jgi:hypothetical protein
MLMRTNGSTTSSPPVTIGGKCVAHSTSSSDAKRARLAALACLGELVVVRMTEGQAAAVFGVPKTKIAAKLKQFGHTLRHSNGGNGHANGNDHANGNGKSLPTWDEFSIEQQSEFLAKNFDAIWNALELRTS